MAPISAIYANILFIEHNYPRLYSHLSFIACLHNMGESEGVKTFSFLANEWTAIKKVLASFFGVHTTILVCEICSGLYFIEFLDCYAFLYILFCGI